MDLLITILLIVFAVWLIGVVFGWFQTSVAGGPRNLLFLLLAILLVILLLREFGLFKRHGRIFCGLHQTSSDVSAWPSARGVMSCPASSAISRAT